MLMRQYIVYMLSTAVFLMSGAINARTRKTKEGEIVEEKQSFIQPQVKDGSSIQDAALSDYELNVEKKQKQVTDLVNKGVEYFNKTKSLEEIFNNFSHNPEYRRGELYLFVYDIEGMCWAKGSEKGRIWKNYLNDRDAYGVPYVRNMIEVAKKGNGWVTYEWYGAMKIAYVTKVTKNGMDFVLGCGYFPFSKEDMVVGLVKGAVSLFNVFKDQGKQLKEVFGIMGYPLGRFVLGDLYIYAMTFAGDHVAHGERYGLIGTNGWDYKDLKGKYVNREIVSKLKKSDTGVWVEYYSKRAPKRTYAEKIVDNKGIEYFIACGYYPDADRDQVIDLVRKGYVFVKSYGLDKAAHEFNDIEHINFRYGDLYLFMFDLEGNCIAEGSNEQLANTNMFDAKDEDGKYYVRQMIKKAQESPGGAWLDYKSKNSFKSVYVELVDLGTGKYVIGSGLFPSTKLETMMLLAKSASGYFQLEPELKKALAEFRKPHGSYARGDLQAFVASPEGVCLVLGSDEQYIWRRYFANKDDSGTPIIKLFNETLQSGPGIVSFTYDNGIKAVAYIEEVTKKDTTYIIGSMYNL